MLHSFYLEGVCLEEIHVGVDFHSREFGRIRKEGLNDLVSWPSLVNLKIELNETKNVILKFLEGFRELDCVELVSHGDLEVDLGHCIREKLAFAHELCAHLVLCQNIYSIQKEMVPLTKVLDLDSQVPIK